jgi:hypothetical protein
MQAALRTTTRVLPGGHVTVSDPELKEGQTVEVIVLPQPHADVTTPGSTGKSPGILELLESLPRVDRPTGYWEERDREFQRERNSWDR